MLEFVPTSNRRSCPAYRSSGGNTRFRGCCIGSARATAIVHAAPNNDRRPKDIGLSQISMYLAETVRDPMDHEAGNSQELGGRSNNVRPTPSHGAFYTFSIFSLHVMITPAIVVPHNTYCNPYMRSLYVSRGLASRCPRTRTMAFDSDGHDEIIANTSVLYQASTVNGLNPP